MRKTIGYFTSFILSLYRTILKPFARSEGSVVIISIHFIGDSVFTIPAIRYIREKYKYKKIYIVCFPQNVRIYEMNFGDKAEIISIDQNQFLLKKRWAPLKYRKLVKSLKPEIIIDTLGSVSSFSLIYGIPAKSVEGLVDPLTAGYYDRKAKMSDAGTLIGGYLAAVGLDEKDCAEIMKFPIRENRNNKIFIDPFGGWKAKQWNFVKFVELYHLLAKEYDVNIIFKKGLIQEDVKQSLIDDNVNLVENNSLDEFFDEIEGCGAFISNDTGPLYVASMFGSPTFGIFGPTNPDFIKPKGDEHAVININLKCSPQKGSLYCFTFGGRKGCPAYECMNLLPVNLVYKSVKTFLEKNNIPGKYIN